MKKSNLSFTAVLILVAASCFAVPASDATLIAGWDMHGLSDYGPSPFDATDGDSNVTIGGLTRGFGVTLSGSPGTNAWGGTGWNVADYEAVNEGKYVTFSVSANPGYSLSLSSIGPYNIRRSGTGPTQGQWQYSLDGSSFTDIGDPITWGAGTGVAGNNQPAIDLTSLSALQDLSAATTVTFRLANFYASSPSGTWYINGTTGEGNLDFQVQGSVVSLPEPGGVTLALLSLSMFAAIRRRW